VQVNRLSGNYLQQALEIEQIDSTYIINFTSFQDNQYAQFIENVETDLFENFIQGSSFNTYYAKFNDDMVSKVSDKYCRAPFLSYKDNGAQRKYITSFFIKMNGQRVEKFSCFKPYINKRKDVIMSQQIYQIFLKENDIRYFFAMLLFISAPVHITFKIINFIRAS
jgi:hypothetical protein